MHPHTLTFAAPISGARFDAPWGPSTRRRPVKPCRVRRYATLDQAQFAYWQRTGEIWRHKRPPIMGAANLVTGDFDDNTVQGWAQNANCSVAATTAQQQAGTHSLQVTATAAAVFSTISAEYAVTAGTSYFATAFVRAAATSRLVAVQLFWYNGSHGFLSQSNGTNVTAVTGSWTRATVGMVNAPATAAFGRLVVSYAAGAAGEVQYVDTATVDDTSSNGLSVGYTTSAGSFTYRAASIAVDGFDIIEASILCYGGGGGGGVRSGIGGVTPGAGGGAGAFVQTEFSLTPGTVYTVTVGGAGGIGAAGGDTWFSSTSDVLADSGKGAINNTPGAGGTVAGSIGTIEFKGGEGGAGSGTTGGGGGGGAGTLGAGGDAAGTTPGTGTAFNGGDGGAQNTAGTIFGGGGGGAAAVTGTAGVGARGLVLVFPTKFRVENNVVTEHIISVPRLLVANRSFAVVTEHVLARTLNVGVTHPIVSEHVTAQGAKSIVKTAFSVITEHVTDLTRRLVAVRTFGVITEHVTALTRTLVLARSFGVVTEHVLALTRRAVLTRSFPVITEHVISLSRSLVAGRSFAIITEHVTVLTRTLVASRNFGVITEHVTAFTRQLGLQRNFGVITEHELSVTKILTFVRDFNLVTEHVVTAAVCMDFDDVPTGGGGGPVTIRPVYVFDDF